MVRTFIPLNFFISWYPPREHKTTLLERCYDIKIAKQRCSNVVLTSLPPRVVRGGSRIGIKTHAKESKKNLLHLLGNTLY